MKRTVTGIGLTVLAIGLTTGSATAEENITIDDIIEEANTAEESLDDYFIELEILQAHGDDELAGVSRQWVKHDGDVTKTRIETGVLDDLMVIVDDGEEVLLYDELSQVVNRLSDDEAALFITSPSSYLESLVEVYDVTVEGTETINDREAYHLVLEPSEFYQEYLEEDSVLEIWLDTEYFIVIKQYEEDEMYGIYDSEFVEFESDADIDDETFVLDIPEDVEIIDGLFNFDDFDFDLDEEFDLDSDLDTEEDADAE